MTQRISDTALDIASQIMDAASPLIHSDWKYTDNGRHLRDAIATALDAHRATTLEKAATIADNFRDVMLNTDLQTEPLLWLDGAEHAARDIATAIRAQASTPTSNSATKKETSP